MTPDISALINKLRGKDAHGCCARGPSRSCGECAHCTSWPLLVEAATALDTQARALADEKARANTWKQQCEITESDRDRAEATLATLRAETPQVTRDPTPAQIATLRARVLDDTEMPNDIQAAALVVLDLLDRGIMGTK